MDIIDKKPYPEDKTGMPNLTPVTPPVSPEEAKAALEKPKKPKPDYRLFVLYGLLIVIGIVVTKYALDFFMPKKPAQQTGQAEKKTILPPFITVASDDQKSQEKGLLSIKKRPNAPSGPFTLTGIYFSGEKGYCIINNKILEQGQDVDGATVAKISLEEVELQMEGKSIRLNLRK